MMLLKNLEDTEKLAEIIGQVAAAGDNLVLTGDLGAGKTTLTKGIAKGLGISQMIKSPTYTIIREYENGRLPLYHMDVYRLMGQTDDLGLDEYFEGEGLSVIEWGTLLEDSLPEDYLELIIEKNEHNENQRQIDFQSNGAKSHDFEKRIFAKIKKSELLSAD
ncbi:tRNA (adenosine(37)-N6)-threonylcarbamoyltransferase complex ATPase subunit type 1 TsaE [Enterococcus sp. LJL120]